MSDDLHLELQQAREEFAKYDGRTDIDVRPAGKHLAAAIASREGNGDRREWDALFRFWRSMIQGGWPCPNCGGQMEYGESSGVRCKTWGCTWVPGRP